MNIKATISALLLLMLAAVSTKGAACEVTCSLAIVSAVQHCAQEHSERAKSSSAAMDMSTMSDADMQTMQQTAKAPKAGSILELTSSSAGHSGCPWNHQWATGQKLPGQVSSIVSPAALHIGFVLPSVTSVPVAASSCALRTQVHRPSSILRI